MRLSPSSLIPIDFPSSEASSQRPPVSKQPTFAKISLMIFRQNRPEPPAICRIYGLSYSRLSLTSFLFQRCPLERRRCPYVVLTSRALGECTDEDFSPCHLIQHWKPASARIRSQLPRRDVAVDSNVVRSTFEPGSSSSKRRLGLDEKKFQGELRRQRFRALALVP